MGTNHHYETEDRLHHAGAKARSAGSRKIPALPEMEHVTIRALRFYEDRGMLRPKRDGSVRWYDDRDRLP